MIIFSRYFNHFCCHMTVCRLDGPFMMKASVFFSIHPLVFLFLCRLFPLFFCIVTHFVSSIIVYRVFCFLFPNSILLLTVHRTCSYHCIINVTDFSFSVYVEILPDVLRSDSTELYSLVFVDHTAITLSTTCFPMSLCLISTPS
jgi:hypothetical protein